jgi:hypothetical protein
MNLTSVIFYVISAIVSVNLVDLFVIFYAAVVACMIYLNPDEVAFCSDRVYRLVKSSKANEESGDNWKMKFEGKWELVARHHFEEVCRVRDVLLV